MQQHTVTLTTHYGILVSRDTIVERFNSSLTSSGYKIHLGPNHFELETVKATLGNTAVLGWWYVFNCLSRTT